MGQNTAQLPQEEVVFNPTGMLDAIRKISKLLATEIALLNDMQIARIHELYEEKIALSAVLEGYRDILKNNPEALNSIPQNTLDAIRREAVTFENLVE